MARRGASGARRIELNRKAFDAITLATADGMFQMAKAIVEGARVPDAEPKGQGLVEGGGVLAFVGRKRVGVWSTSGAAVKKPRRAKLSGGVTVLGGYGFPARFLEEGTVHMGAQPFLTPQLMATAPEARDYVRAACKRHRVTGKQRAARGDVFRGGLK